MLKTDNVVNKATYLRRRSILLIREPDRRYF
nr:MAG TPA: hypothetical protein [Caudoviricetes sp.]